MTFIPGLRLSILAGILAAAAPSLGQWTQTAGPTGGFIRSMAQHGAQVFAGTDEGLFSTSNLGVQWNENGLGIIRVLALHSDGSNLLAGVSTGVRRSTDGGANWSAGTDLPSNPGISLASLGTLFFAGLEGGGVHASADGGASWTAAGSALADSSVPALLGIGSRLVAGTDHGVVFVSDDSGSTWTLAAAGPGAASLSHFALMGVKLFAAGAGGVYQSLDSGMNWSAAGAMAVTAATRLTVAGTRLIAGTDSGVFYSDDSGATWSAAAGAMRDPRVLSFLASGADWLAGTESGIFHSADAGANWTLRNAGLIRSIVFSFAAQGSDLFAGTWRGGIFKTANAGAAWSPVSSGFPNTPARSLAAMGNRVFAGTNQGIYRTDNGGTSWTSSSAGLGGSNVPSLAVDSNRLYAGTDSNGVYVSVDSGANWTAAHTGMGATATVPALVPGYGYVFAGTTGGGIFRSVNGSNWTAMNSGLGSLNVTALALGGGVLFAGTDGGGVYRSADSGATWTAASSGLTNQRIWDLLWRDGDLVAATVGGVFLSRNSGQTWTPVQDNLDFNDVRTLILIGDSLYAGTWGGGVWRRPFSEIAPLPPGAPALASPADGAIDLNLLPVLRWHELAGAATYQLQVATAANFASPLVNDSGLADTAFQMDSLNRGVTYHWRVRGANAGGNGPWSAGRSFTTLPPAPAAPVLVSPANAAGNVSSSPTLVWNRVSGAATYRIQVSRVADFATMIEDSVGHADSSLGLSGLDPATVYYWRVGAVNSGGAGAFSSSRSFTTTPLAPGAPALVSPANGATNVPASPTLVWNRIAGAGSYRVQLSRAADFSTLVRDSSGADSSLGVSGLEAGALYYWRVSATNAGGTGPWSTRQFTVVAPVSLLPGDFSARFQVDAGYLQFALPKDSEVRITLLDGQGKSAYTFRGHKPAGFHRLEIPRTGNGIYLLRFQAGAYRKQALVSGR